MMQISELDYLIPKVNSLFNAWAKERYNLVNHFTQGREFGKSKVKANNYEIDHALLL